MKSILTGLKLMTSKSSSSTSFASILSNPILAGNFVGQGVNFLSFPIWLHFYSTESVADFGVFSAIASLMSIVLTLKIENLVMALEDNRQGTRKLSLAYTTISFLSIPMFLVSLAVTSFIPMCENFNPFLLAFYAILNAMVNVSVAWCVVQKRRKQIALYAIFRPLLSVVFVTIFGIGTEHDEFFLLSQALALSVTFLAVFSRTLRFPYTSLRALVEQVQDEKRVISSYVLEGLIHGLASNAIFLAIAWTCDPEIAALYFFADKVFQALSQVLIESERPIHIQRYLDLNSIEVASDQFKQIDFRVIKLGVLGLVISFTSVPYIAVINSWPQGLYIGIYSYLFLLWFLRFYLMKYTAFSIVFKMPWYVLSQSFLQLFSVVLVFSLKLGGDSVVTTLGLIFLIQLLTQTLLIILLKRSTEGVIAS